MPAITFTVDDVFRRYAEQVGIMGRGEAARGMARAVNSVMDVVHARIIPVLNEQSQIPVWLLNASITRTNADDEGGTLTAGQWGGANAIMAKLTAKGPPLSLKWFAPVQDAVGVHARWGGEMHDYPSHFMGPQPGLVSVALGGNVWRRRSQSRLPIDMIYGPSVPEEMMEAEPVAVFNDTVDELLMPQLDAELSRLLPS